MRHTSISRSLAALAILCCCSAADPKVLAPYGITPTTPTSRHPIDLPTVLRLVDSGSPAVGVARARYREAAARLEQAELLWIPNLAMGTTYIRHDGNTQNQAGLVFGVSRSSLFAGGAAQLRVDTADAYFLPLVARRVAQAESHLARATNINVQYEAASAYLDLLQAHAGSFIVADTLARAEQMLLRAEAAIAAGLSKTAGDANRARTEVNLRRQEAQDFQARSAVAVARLARLLGLSDTTEVVPVEETIVPITLVPTTQTIDDMVLTAWAGRPEMAAQQALVAAAAERLRQARLAPLFPKVQLEYSGGSFGGGRNDTVAQFEGRGDLVASAFWELKNFGFGNRAQARERNAQLDQAAWQDRAVRAQIAAEVTEAARAAAARFGALDAAQTAVKEALELYRKLLESSFGMAGPQPRYDALEPLLAIQALHQARLQYLLQVIEFNRAQFRLYTALGQPAECSLPGNTDPMTSVPVIPKP